MGYVGCLDDDGEAACSAEYPHGMPRYQSAPGYRLEVFLDATALAIDQVAAIEGCQAVRSPRIIDEGERPSPSPAPSTGKIGSGPAAGFSGKNRVRF
jgi:hypothetical protein